MRHYPLLDKGIDISGLEPMDLAIIVGVAFVFALIGYFFLGMYTAFVFITVLIVAFALIRKFKSNKYRGYIARKIFYWYLRRHHKIY